MAQLDGLQRYGDNPRSPKTPTIEQFLRASNWSPNASPTLRNHDPEEDHGAHHHKKSVLTKVKEKAKKLRHTLSHRKRHDDDDNTTPSWGVRLEDYEDIEDENEDPEFIGAQMYESEMAPEGLKETVRQHPKSTILEKHVLTSPDKHGVGQEREKLSSPNKTVTETMTEKLAPAYTRVSNATHAITSKIHCFNGSPQAAATETNKHPYSEKPSSPNKTITDTGTEKLAPVYARVSDATHAITSKIHGFTGSPRAAATETDKYADQEKPYSPNKTITETGTEKLSLAYATSSDATHAIISKIHGSTGSPQAGTTETDKHANQEKHYSPNKSITETVTENLSPAYAARSDATHTITSKIHGLTGSPQAGATETDKHADQEKPYSPNKTITETVTEKLSPAYATRSDATHTITSKIHGFNGSPNAGATETDKYTDQEKPYSPKKTIPETMTEKLSSAYATMSDASHAITSKFQGLTAGSEAQPADTETDKHSAAKTNKPVSLEKPHNPKKTTTETMTKKLAPAYARVSDATHAVTSKIQGLASSTQAEPETDKYAVVGDNNYKDDVEEKKKLSAPEFNMHASVETKHPSTGEQIWDKGVSVKEYIMQKFEPGEDDRALSQVISQAISPRKTHGDPGVVERVKGAVNSFLWDEESNHPTVTHSPTTSISNIPISTNAHEVVEEENHGRILQAN